MLLTQRLQQSVVVAKGDIQVPTPLVEDVFAPDLALRTGHHILYLMQVRAACLHRGKAVQNHRFRRKKAFGA